MQILYYGQLKEVGAKICNSLSKSNEVCAVATKPSDYELNCKCYLKKRQDVTRLLRELEPQLLLVYEPDETNYKELYEMLYAAQSANVQDVILLQEANFCRRIPIDLELERLLCREFSQNGMNAFIAECSSLYGRYTVPDCVTALYTGLQKTGQITFPSDEKAFCDALHIDDLCTWFEIMSEQDFTMCPVDEIVQIQSAYPFELGKFAKLVCARYPHAAIQYSEDHASEQHYMHCPMESWAPRHAFLDYVDECIDMAEEMYKKRRKEEHANIKSSAGKVAAILIAFFAIELYMQFVPHASDLQFVDLRLLLIVWSGLIAGKQMGLVSAVCCSVGSIIQCLASGVKWYVIFYHVDNWIPLAVYFIAAILIGTYYEAIQEQNARREDDDHPMDP